MSSTIFQADLSQMRRDILKAAHLAGEGHIASAFSVLEIIYGIYTSDKFANNRDSRFMLSKGHASLALYAVLGDRKLIPDTWVQDFCKINSAFGGHPDSTRIPEIQISAGSLGHGLPFAVGVCLSQRAKNRNGDVIVLIGDGELNEGTNWESLLVAAHHKLSNLHIFVDLNNSGERAVSLGNLVAKFEAFECNVSEIDGHDIELIHKELERKSDKIKVSIARTIKGFGVLDMENNPEWHHKVPDEKQFLAFMEELK